MANDAEIGAASRKGPWRVAGWTIAALALLTPLAAMQFSPAALCRISERAA